MPIRAAQVVRSQPFDRDMKRLQARFPEIEQVIGELTEVLALEYQIPHQSVDPDQFGPRVHAAKVDYPPEGASGEGKLIVTYHRTDPPTPSPETPYRTYTLLRIDERQTDEKSRTIPSPANE